MFDTAGKQLPANQQKSTKKKQTELDSEDEAEQKMRRENQANGLLSRYYRC